MPYTLKKLKGGRWAIVRKADGKTVGTSDSRAKAGASIGHRMSGDSSKKDTNRNRKTQDDNSLANE